MRAVLILPEIAPVSTHFLGSNLTDNLMEQRWGIARLKMLPPLSFAFRIKAERFR
jgi:hypothetical protein